MYDDSDDTLESVPRHSPARHGSIMALSMITSGLTSAIIFFALYLGVPRLGLKIFTVEVPSIVGVSVDQARQLLDPRGIYLTLADEQDNPEIPAGAIVSQTPLNGSRVRRGTEIRAIVSSGMQLVTVPDVSRLSLGEARGKLMAAKLGMGAQMEESHPEIPEGQVTRTKPAAQEKTASGTAMQIVVSSGPTDIEVPSVIGMSLSRARRELEGVGLALGAKMYTYNEDRAGEVVLRQSPSAGSTTAAGTKIDLVINEGD